jgi:transcriptional regulator with XRE-family HTH domain
MSTSKSSAITPEQFTSFGELLKFLRRRAGLSQRELSIAVGYSESQISRLERNERAAETAILAARFVEALDLEQEPDWLKRLLELAAESRAERETGEQHGQALTRLHNLPTPLTSFVGREAELELAYADRLRRNRQDPPCLASCHRSVRQRDHYGGCLVGRTGFIDQP